MKDVKINDEIIDGTGKVTVVTDIFPQGIKPVYKVTFSDRTSVLCSDEHLWKVGEYNSHKKCVNWKVISLNEMLTTGIRKKHNKTETRIRYRIPIPILDCWENKKLPIDPYLLGLLIGDGGLSLCTDRITRISFGNIETDILKNLNILLNNIGCELVKSSETSECDYRIRNKVDAGNNLKSNYNYYYKDKFIGDINAINNYLTQMGYKTHDYRVYKNASDGNENTLKAFPELRDIKLEENKLYLNTPIGQLGNTIVNLGLNKCSVEKHIPKEYLYTTVENRIKLLQGLFDTDGYVDNRKARSVLQFSTSSPQLSEDFAFLVRSLGGTDTVVRKKAGYRKGGEYIQCNDSYEHNIKFSTDILPFTSNKHMSKYVEPQNKAQRRIVDIEYIGEQECQCIKVSSGDHTYITDNVIVTHNTTSARIIANMMNNNQGKPIEIDCASHNGVDDVRKIIDECKTKPLIGKYKTFVLDECHQLSIQAWNAMLKILEEPPEYVIFLLCTTDPQKIIPTVLSRVQRFNFHKISIEGIVNRLTYILQNENITSYEVEAVRYIARLAKGGMRDSITTLEKCLDYSENLTLQNVLKVTSGGVTEESMLELLAFILNKDCSGALEHFNKIYMSGVDTSLFYKLFLEFIENCCKFLITRDINITTLSNVTAERLEQGAVYMDGIRNCLLDLVEMETFISSEDLRIKIESWIIKVCK